MIYAFTGKGGSSKTFNMVKTARWYWKHGINIYSNTKLLFSKYDDRLVKDIDNYPKDFSLFEKLIHALFKKNYKRGKIIYFDTIDEIQNVKDGLVLFDEGQVLFNSGSWKEISDEFKYKVSQERKHDLDFITTTRRWRSILIDYRQEVHEWYHCKEIIAIKYGPKNRKKILIGLFRVEKKDIEASSENLPDDQNPVEKQKYFFIWKGKKRLYDTKYDIGFKPLKMIRVNSYDNILKKWQKSFMIIPKKMKLKDVLSAISMTNRISSPTKWKTSFKNTRSYA